MFTIPLLLRRYTLSVNSVPYYSQQNPQLNEASDPSRSDGDQMNSEFRPPLWVPERTILGERLLLKVNEIIPVRKFKMGCFI